MLDSRAGVLHQQTSQHITQESVMPQPLAATVSSLLLGRQLPIRSHLAVSLLILKHFLPLPAHFPPSAVWLLVIGEIYIAQ